MKPCPERSRGSILVLTALTALLALWTMTVFGAVPQLINFQGVLKDGSGNPVANGNYPVVFTIYDAPSAGTALWAETTSVSTVGGTFSVLLGSTNPVPDSAFKDSARWLAITVGADPEMTPRQRLVSVGYAFRVAHFIPDFGTDNTFIGLNAGNLTMTGGYNTASGAYAFFGNTTGSINTASGFYALGSNTSGGDNTASGFYALGSNTSGGDNTASGVYALGSNTTGYYNTASGVDALYRNTTGDYNTASGAYALGSNTTGNYNTASGLNALSSNTIGYKNNASGVYALFGNTTGSNNTASGYSALYSNTTGNSNTASGLNALGSNTTGSNNTAIGYFANVSAGNLINATAIGNGAVVDASNKIRLGNSAVTVIEGQVDFTFTSDRNQKENFRPVDGEEVLQKIRGFNLTSWNYKGHDPKQFRHYGPMAQDFFAAFGEDGVGKIGTETTLNSGDVAGILMVAVQALNETVQKQDEEIKELKNLVQKLLAKKEGESQTYTLNNEQKGGVK